MVEFGCQKYKDQIQDLLMSSSHKDILIREKEQTIDAWKMDYKQLKYDKDLELSILKIKLTKALKDTIQIPTIKPYLDVINRWNPWIDKRLYDYRTVIADRFYYQVADPDWFDILKLCQESVVDAQVKWISEVGDCDNWAEAMHYVVSNATLRAKLNHQLAFTIAYSDTHAYNLYFDWTCAWVYEPQNGKTIGKLGETPEPYVTKRIFLMS